MDPLASLSKLADIDAFSFLNVWFKQANAEKKLKRRELNSDKQVQTMLPESTEECLKMSSKPSTHGKIG